MTTTPGHDDADALAEYTEPVPYTPTTPRPDDLVEARACLETASTIRSEMADQYLARATAHATIALADALTALAARPQYTAELGEVGEISDDALYATAAAVAADLLEMDAAEDIRLDKWAAAEELVRLVHPNALRFAHVEPVPPADRPISLRCATHIARGSVNLIAAERQRQIDSEGYTATSDARFPNSDYLAMAAVTYASPAERRRFKFNAATPSTWPWGPEFFKPTPGDRVRELVKAGALIVAAIDWELSLSETRAAGQP